MDSEVFLSMFKDEPVPYWYALVWQFLLPMDQNFSGFNFLRNWKYSQVVMEKLTKHWYSDVGLNCHWKSLSAFVLLD